MFILASASPRRQELLKFVIEKFEVIPSNSEEVVTIDLPVFEHPEYLAKLKACDIADKYPNDIIIGADTSVIVDNEILGKPKDEKMAKIMLKALSGKKHKVITGCAVAKNGECNSFSVSTEVEFYELTDNEIDDYIATGEPFDKAGGYGIQGKGSLLVRQIKGDYFNVVGLPIASLARFLMNK